MNHGCENRGIVTISKGQLASLPAAQYPGIISVIDTKEKMMEALKEIQKAPIIGFDTETKPSFKKGQQFNVALVQLSTTDICYLFRTNIIGFPTELKQILEDPGKLKVGLSLHDDFLNLGKFGEFNPESFIDLQSFTKEYRIADNSLSRVYAILFGQRISKGQRLTNWEANQLSDAQKNYAALDAYACVRIYNYLKEGNFNPDQSPYLTFPQEENDIERESEV